MAFSLPGAVSVIEDLLAGPVPVDGPTHRGGGRRHRLGRWPRRGLPACSAVAEPVLFRRTRIRVGRRAGGVRSVPRLARRGVGEALGSASAFGPFPTWKAYKGKDGKIHVVEVKNTGNATTKHTTVAQTERIAEWAEGRRQPPRVTRYEIEQQQGPAQDLRRLPEGPGPGHPGPDLRQERSRRAHRRPGPHRHRARASTLRRPATLQRPGVALGRVTVGPLISGQTVPRTR